MHRGQTLAARKTGSTFLTNEGRNEQHYMFYMFSLLPLAGSKNLIQAK